MPIATSSSRPWNRSADGPALMFIQVPEQRTGKNRLHVDLATSDWSAELDRLVGLGTKRLDEHNSTAPTG